MPAKKEPFVSLESITDPDSRSTIWVRLNKETGEWCPKTLEEHYEDVGRIEIHESIPEEVYHHLLEAKHLLLYSWYRYRFLPIAYSQALGSVEFALKTKAKMENYDLGSKSGLKYLLKTAIKEKWLRNENLRYFPELHAWKRKRNDEMNALADKYFGKKTRSKTIVQEPEDIDYLAILLHWLPIMRNSLAHGSSYLTRTHNEVEVCADVVNALFRDERHGVIA